MSDRAAPETEIEITPEMIEAGLREFYKYDSRFDPEEEAVVRIFNAMIRSS